jgi:hypothetical protein
LERTRQQKRSALSLTSKYKNTKEPTKTLLPAPGSHTR